MSEQCSNCNYIEQEIKKDTGKRTFYCPVKGHEILFLTAVCDDYAPDEFDFMYPEHPKNQKPLKNVVDRSEEIIQEIRVLLEELEKIQKGK